MPVLLHWGLPISVMSFVGNFLFTPALVALTVLGSLVFFAELAGIPNGLCITLFDYISTTWYWLLSFGQPSWLIERANPGLGILVLIPAATIAGLWLPQLQKINSTQERRSLFMFAVLISSFGLLSLQQYCTTQQPLTDLHTKIMCSKNNDGTINMIDDGYFNTKSNAENAVRFAIKPYLTQNFGTTTIASLTLDKPGYRSFCVAQQLVVQCPVKSITLPYFEPLDKKGWHAFFTLKRLCTEKGCTMLRRSLASSALNLKDSDNNLRKQFSPKPH